MLTKYTFYSNSLTQVILNEQQLTHTHNLPLTSVVAITPITPISDSYTTLAEQQDVQHLFGMWQQ